MSDSYAEFLSRKGHRDDPTGLLDVPDISEWLFPFQRDVVEFSLRRGRSGIFLGTGLGKSGIQLECSKHAAASTNGRALILTPLAVAGQMAMEGSSRGYDCRVIRDQSEARDGINICNYDRLCRLDPDAFGSVSLDEGSCIKAFGGKTTRMITDAFSGHRFRFSATATPAPNDHMELGTQAEFLGVIDYREMLSRWFINDTSTASQKWRMKGHAIGDFWRWVASWAMVATMPSDLGYSDDGYVLPPLSIVRHRAKSAIIKSKDGELFSSQSSATTIFNAKRQTAGARADIVAALVYAEPIEPWVCWCDTDGEADALMARIPGAVEVRGSMKADEKEEAIEAFLSRQARVLITKPSICGYGLNFQFCARTAFVGRTFSFEMWHQAVRRFHRFGQKRPVVVHIAVAEGEQQADAAIARKEADHDRMRREVVSAIRGGSASGITERKPYKPTHDGRIPEWLTA